MSRWMKVARGAGMLMGAAWGNMGPGRRVQNGIAGLGLLQEAMNEGPGSARQIEVGGIQDRLRIIAGNIRAGARHPPIVSLARRIVSRRCGDEWCIAPRDEIGMVHEIHATMPRLVRWVKDPIGVDWYAHPRHTFDDKAGDCDEAVAAEGALLGSVQIYVDLIAGQEVGARDYNHVWLVAFPENAPEIQLDPTFEQAPAGWSIPAGRLVRTFRYPVWG